MKTINEPAKTNSESVHTKVVSTNFKKILIGIMAGITTGTILGIQLSSKKGIEARKKVLSKGERYLKILIGRIQLSIRNRFNQIGQLFVKPRHTPD